MWFLTVTMLATMLLVMVIVRVFLDLLGLVLRLPLILGLSLAILVAYLLWPLESKAEIYTYKGGMQISAENYKAASRFCFRTLTKGKYPGEERGLEIIDICANPIKGDIK